MKINFLSESWVHHSSNNFSVVKVKFRKNAFFLIFIPRCCPRFIKFTTFFIIITSGCGRFAWNFIVKTVAVAEAEVVVVVDVAVAQSLEGRGGGVR